MPDGRAFAFTTDLHTTSHAAIVGAVAVQFEKDRAASAEAAHGSDPSYALLREIVLLLFSVINMNRV